MNTRRKPIHRGYRWFALLIFVMGFSLVSNAQTYSPVCPSKDINEILKAPDVQAAISQAIRDSNVGQHNEQEVGANIIQKYRTTNGRTEYFYDVTLVQGGVGSVTLPKIEERKGRTSRLVATFHTHPGPKGHWTRTLSDGTEIDNIGLHENEKPSPEDLAGADKRGVPAFIVSDFIAPDPETSHVEIYNDPPAKPRKMSWECPAAPPPPKTGNTLANLRADCGEAATGGFKIKNHSSIPTKFRIESNADWLTIATSETGGKLTVLGGQEGGVGLSADCADCCLGTDEVRLAKVSIHQVQSDGSEKLNGEGDVWVRCDAKPKKCASSSGDPHLCSHDGLRYDFHGVGEYVLSKTEGFEAQVRYKAAPNSRFASVNAAIAARFGENRIAVYSGDPVRLTINGVEVEERLSAGEFIWLEGGLTIERLAEFFRFRSGSFLIDVTAGPDRLGKVLLRIPENTGSVGLLGSRDGDRKNDITSSDGTRFTSPVLFDDLTVKYGNSWRVKQADSLFDYGSGETTETFTSLLFPSRKTSITDLGSDSRRAAEAICRKAGITGADLEDCTYDVALTGDESFVHDAKGGREDIDRLEIKEKPLIGRESADGVKIELPSEAIASFPVEIHVSGPAEAHTLTFTAVGNPASSRAPNAYSSIRLKGGDQVVRLHAPYFPGEYELRYVTFPGNRNVLLSIPFISVAPSIKIEAAEVGAAGGRMDIYLHGDLSTNMKVTVVPVGSRNTFVGWHAYIKGGLSEKVTIRSLPRQVGKYEIRVVSSTSETIYARKEIEIR